MLKMWEESNLRFEHFTDGDINFTGITNEEIDPKCDELFSFKPIPFIPKKGD
jgi:hypothetical protein